MTNGH